MAKTVDNFATIEDFRKQYNELAYDVGDVVGLNDALKSGSNDTIVDAINVLDNKQFFLQEFVYVATNNQVTFSGADSLTNSLIFKKDHVQVYKNERHLVEDVDYIVGSSDGAGAFLSIILQGTYASGQANAMSAGDRLTIYSYTGAFIGTEIAGSASTFFQKSGSGNNEIYNTNAGGIILNGDNSSATTTLESGYTVQLAGKTFAEDDIITTVAGKKFQAPILSDSIASLTAGSLTGAVNITASGTVQAEQLTTTDDATITGAATVGETLGVTGTTTLTNLITTGNVDLGDAISDTISFGGTVDTNITPNVNNTGKVGISTRKWDEMHATDFHGNLTGNVTGNADTATTLATPRNISGVAFNGSANIELNTSHIDEDSGSNKYFTDARADTRADVRIAASSIGALQDVTVSGTPNAGQILVWDTGSGGRWTVANNSNTTDSVSEGVNKYFTDERVNAVIVAGNGLAKAFVDDPDGSGDTSVDGQTTLSVNTSNGVKLDGDDVELDYSVITDGDLSGGLPSGSGKSVGHLYFLI